MGDYDAWAPQNSGSDVSDEYVEIDMGRDFDVTALVTRGSQSRPDHSHSFMVRYSLYYVTWTWVSNSSGGDAQVR